MSYTKKMNFQNPIKFFKNEPKLRQTFYLVLALIWLWLNWRAIFFYPLKSSYLGISYIWVGVVPIVVLLTNAIYPYFVGWLLLIFTIILGWSIRIYHDLIFAFAHSGVKIEPIELLIEFLLDCIVLIVLFSFCYLFRPLRATN